jgi:BASS family bile acid:Na+ symporter
MKTIYSLIGRLTHWIHHNLIWLVISSYGLAMMFPALGLTLRSIEFTNIQIFSASSFIVSLPLLMLAVLLFNAGLGVNTQELQQTWQHPKMLISGLVSNSLVPLIFIVLVRVFMLPWHNSEEVQKILVGLAFIAAMPIAGASTAWTQNTNGNLALSLSLVLATTLLSPLFTPLIFHSIGFVTTGDYSEDLHEIASGETIGFLGIWVVLPTLLGIFTRYFLNQEFADSFRVNLKLCNYLVLLLLNYMNAAVVLPKMLSNPDIDFLLVIVVITSLLCLVTFSSGYYLAKFFRTNRKNTLSLMFGLGMSNNGTALVLASIALADHPEIMIPIIVYNLIQHLMASFVDRFNTSLAHI